MKDFFTHRYVMSVKENDRTKKFYQWAKPLDVTTYYGKTPSDFPEKKYKGMNCLAINFKDILSKLKIGDTLLFFEDDCIPHQVFTPEKFWEKLDNEVNSLPEDWEFYFPGSYTYNIRTAKKRFCLNYASDDENFYRLTRWYGCHSFAIKMTERLYPIIEKYISSNHLGHIDTKIRLLINQHNLNAYFSKIPLTEQDMYSYSLINGSIKDKGGIKRNKGLWIRDRIKLNLKENIISINPNKYLLYDLIESDKKPPNKTRGIILSDSGKKIPSIYTQDKGFLDKDSNKILVNKIYFISKNEK